MLVRVLVRMLVRVPMRVFRGVLMRIATREKLARHAMWFNHVITREHHAAHVEAASLVRPAGLTQERAVLVLWLWYLRGEREGGVRRRGRRRM
jgi:hypothetical protein